MLNERPITLIETEPGSYQDRRYVPGPESTETILAYVENVSPEERIPSEAGARSREQILIMTERRLKVQRAATDANPGEQVASVVIVDGLKYRVIKEEWISGRLAHTEAVAELL